MTVKAVAPIAAWIAPDGSRLAVISRRLLEIADLSKNEAGFAWKGIYQQHAVSWSPDGRLLAVAGNGEESDGGNLSWAAWVHVFDPEKRRRIWRQQHGSSRVAATAVAWSPDGQQLVSGDENGLAENTKVKLGLEHPDTLTSMRNLGLLYQAQGQFAKAEPLYVKALEVRRRVLGEEHRDTLFSMNDLGLLYQAQGQFAKAEPLYRMALEQA